MQLLATLMLTVLLACAGVCFGQPFHASLTAMIREDGLSVQKLSVEGTPTAVRDRLAELGAKYEKLSPDAYVMATASIVNIAGQSKVRSDAAVRDLLVVLADKVMSKIDGSEMSPVVRDKQFAVFLRIFGSLDRGGKEFRKERDGRTTLLLVKWNDLLKAIAEVEIYKDATLEPWTPPASYEGPFISGARSGAITDPQVRQEYEIYLRTRDEIGAATTELRQLQDIQTKYQARVGRFLADAYGADEADQAEMKRLVEKHIEEKDLAVKLLENVAEARAKGVRPVVRAAK